MFTWSLLHNFMLKLPIFLPLEVDILGNFLIIECINISVSDINCQNGFLFNAANLITIIANSSKMNIICL